MRAASSLLILTFFVFSCKKDNGNAPKQEEPLPEFNMVLDSNTGGLQDLVVVNSDGGYVGTYVSSVLKFDKNGNKEWQKRLPIEDYDGRVGPITAGLDGSYVMVGTAFRDDIIVPGYSANPEALVVKTDRNGNMVWQKLLGGSNDDNANDIISSADGGYVMVGNTASNDRDVSGYHGNYDAWVVKLDKDGNIEWQKTLGGSDWDLGQSIINTSDGGYLMAGETVSNDGDVTGNHGNQDIWIVKLDNVGNIIWQKQLGGSSGESSRSVTELLDGNYAIAGETISNDGDVSGNHSSFNSDAWLITLDKDGTLLWQKAIGGSESDGAYSIVASLDGGCVMVGETESDDGDVSGYHNGFDIYNWNGRTPDLWIVKFDKKGAMLWQKSMGGQGADIGYSIIARPDGSYVVGGVTWSNDGDLVGRNGNGSAWMFTLKDE